MRLRFWQPHWEERDKEAQRGAYGRCCWEGNVVHSIDLWGERWSIHLNLPRDSHSLNDGCSIPSPRPNFTWEHRPDHVLEGDLGGQDLGKQPKERGEGSRCQAQRMPALWTPSPLIIRSAPFQGGSISGDNPIPPGQPSDLWRVLLHPQTPINPRAWAGPLLFCEQAKGWVGLSTVHRGQDKGKLFELKN